VEPSTPLRLETERLVLRELRADDWRDARALDGDREVVRYQTNDVSDEAATRAYLERSIAAAACVPRLVFDLAVTLRGEDRLLGRAGCTIEKPEHREAQIFCSLRRDAWRHGYAVEAGRAVLAFAFGPLQLHRVYGDCDPRNAGSARAMEKLGLRLEGHLRENWFLKGEWCDSLIYAVLAHEYAALPAR
jgi:RimJ/RimL family protein N-acetyltransferase